MTGFVALYVLLLAAVAGYELIARVPVAQHPPLASALQFIHGIVLAGAIVALGYADTTPERVIGFAGVALAAANVFGGWAVTDRVLGMARTGGREK